jgi:drug/metabolite transporter superfamily protein YnfA
MAIISRIVATFQIAHFSRVYAAYRGVFVTMR